MEFKIEKINDEVVKPIKTTKIEPSKIKGYELFPEIYSNIFLCAKKKSGKTSVINKIIKDCTDQDTSIYVFCSTHNKDENWIQIKKWLAEKQMNAHFFLSLEEDNINLLNLIIEDLQSPTEEPEKSESSSEEEDTICHFEDDKISVKIKKKKPRKIAPKILFIFDDFSGELKDKNLIKLLKENRHYKSKVIISSQYPNDMRPDSRSQLDYWILFGAHNDEKLLEIYQFCTLGITFEKFKELYKFATKDKYNFLYIDRANEEYRKNFNNKIIF